MRLFDHLSSLRLLYYYEKVLGLCPSISDDEGKLRLSNWGRSYNLAISGAYTLTYMVAINKRINLRLPRETTLIIVMDTFALTFQYLAIVSSWLSLALWHGGLERIYHGLRRCENLAREMQMSWPLDDSRYTRIVVARLVLINALYISVYTVDHYAMTFTKRYREQADTWVWFNLQKIVMYNMYIIFLELALILFNGYKTLNQHLRKNFTRSNTGVSYGWNLGIASLQPTQARLQVIGQCHESLTDLLENIMTFFSLPILFSIVANFINMFTDVYIIHQFLTYDQIWSVGEICSYIAVLTWLSTKILGIYFICGIPDSASIEANNTIVTLNRILIYWYEDRSCREKMKALMWKLYRRKFGFSVSGFFNLNYCLLSNCAIE